jgi:hypothetical protein
MSYESPSLNTATAEADGPHVREYPFFNDYQDATHVVIAQKHVQRATSYTPLAMNTAATIDGISVRHIGDDGISGADCGLVGFTRRWANVPAVHYDYELTAISYPGYIFQREPTTQTTMLRVDFDYFLIGTGGDYATPDLIPLVAESRVTNALGLDVSIFDGGTWLVDGGSPTTPSLTAYKALVTTDAATSSYSLVLDSKIHHYLGGIWCRVTRRAKAK